MIFHNPVKVDWGKPWFTGLSDFIAGRTTALVTTPGAAERGLIDSVIRAAGDNEVRVTTGVRPNPTVASIQENAAEITRSGTAPELIIALGGGSSIDTAKGIAAISSPGCSAQWFSDHLQGSAPFPDDFAPPAIIAIPTTAGTGSEVTMWGTVWDEESGAKYSISHPRLFAERAILVPELTLTCSSELTVITALDALSHCMESVWNKRASAVSDAFAAAGISLILDNLSHALKQPDDIDARRRLQEAALLGGFAISCTATALAHSISYPLTSQLGMPHGLACSFTLPELIRFNGEEAPRRIAVIAEPMKAAGVNAASVSLTRFFFDWGVPALVRSYISDDKARALKDRLLTPGRADNNVRPASHDDALRIVLLSI